MDNKNTGTPPLESPKHLSKIEQLLYFGAQAPLPWHIIAGVIMSWIIISGDRLREELTENYANRAKVITEKKMYGIKEVTTYECGEKGSFTEDICWKVSTLIDVGDKHIPLLHWKNSLTEKEIRDIWNFFNSYPEKSSALVAKYRGLATIRSYDTRGIEPEFIRDGGLLAQKETKDIAQMIEMQIPALKNKVWAEWFQSFLTDEEVQIFKNLFEELDFRWEFNLVNIETFLGLIFNNPERNTLNPDNIKQVLALSEKFHGGTKILLQWEKTMSINKYSDTIRADIIVLLTSILGLLLFAWKGLPFAWIVKVVKEEIETIPMVKPSVEQKERFERYRMALWFHGYDEFIKMYYLLKQVPSKKIIQKKWPKDSYIFGKDERWKWGMIEKIQGRYILKGLPTHFPDHIPDDITFAYCLQDYWYTRDNIEIVDVEWEKINGELVIKIL